MSGSDSQPGPVACEGRIAPFSVVIIGRNEVERPKRGFASVARAALRVVYVDYGSTDGSVEWARREGAAP